MNRQEVVGETRVSDTGLARVPDHEEVYLPTVVYVLVNTLGCKVCRGADALVYGLVGNIASIR